MPKAFVLMTAMPPTTGHLQLIQFADLLTPDEVVVILCTQPHEPFAFERVIAMQNAILNHRLTKVRISHYHRTIEQNPQAPGFWEMWRNLMLDFGMQPGDYVVSSETYGKKVAELTQGVFYPYDIERCINPVKATPIRENFLTHFSEIIPEFQPFLRNTITIFGAESTGKSTLSGQLSIEMNGHWLFEYARPYLENTINEITVRSMEAIWKGQSALQRQANNLLNKPLIVQDTDLFSTIGYWQLPSWQEKLGDCPFQLIQEAQALQSDLYIITPSTIPFEADPLRYGGDVREGSDEYWVGICEKYNLPYKILQSHTREDRLNEAKECVKNIEAQKVALMNYDRKGY